MNLRFASGSIRVRVSADEFSQLRGGKTLSLKVVMTGHHVFRAGVSLATDDQWHFDSDPTGLWMSVPRTEVEALAENLPSREGIEHVFETTGSNLIVSLEVDVKKHR